MASQQALSTALGAVDLSDSHTSPTAAQRALQLPEIISVLFENIFRYGPEDWAEIIPDDDEDRQDYFNAWDDLTSCSLVNRIWHVEAKRLLVIEPMEEPMEVFAPNGLSGTITNIPESRRQFYARYIKDANLWSVSDEEIGKINELLSGLEFTRLKYLRIFIDHDHRLPRINAPNLEALHLDPRREYYPDYWAVTQDGFELIMNEVVVSHTIDELDHDKTDWHRMSSSTYLRSNSGISV